MRFPHTSPVHVSVEKVDRADPQSIDRSLESLGIAYGSHVSCTLPAGKNREFNGPASVSIAGRIRQILGEKSAVDVIARVDDEELWPERTAALRQMAIRDRIERLRDVSRSTVMDAQPYLVQIEEALGEQGLELMLLTQPLCNSYMEVFWSLQPPDAALALPPETTHLVLPASCRPLQQRMQFAAKDAVKAGGISECLRHVAILHHADINEADESKSFAVARLLRTIVGGKGYRQIALGEGLLGSVYKKVQDWKIRRAGLQNAA